MSGGAFILSKEVKNLEEKKENNIKYILMIVLSVLIIAFVLAYTMTCITVYADESGRSIDVDGYKVNIGVSATWSDGKSFNTLDVFDSSKFKDNFITSNYYYNISTLQSFTCAIRLDCNNGILTCIGFFLYDSATGKYNFTGYEWLDTVGFNLELQSTNAMYYIITKSNINYNNSDYQSELNDTACNYFLSYIKSGVLPDGMRENKDELKPVYDLEIPLDFKIKNHYNIDIGPLELGVKRDQFTLSWHQSDNINNAGWETEIYIEPTFSTRQHLWSTAKSTKIDYKLYDTVLNSKNKYKVNLTEKKYMKTLYDDLFEKLGYEPAFITLSNCQFMVRNKWTNPDTQQIHYSNYVYTDGNFKDGYKSYEIDGKKFDEGITNGDKFDDTLVDNARKTDSDLYTGQDTTGTSGTSNNDFTDSTNNIGILKSLSNDLKDFPRFFTSFFDFIPNHIIAGLTALIALSIILGFLRAVF